MEERVCACQRERARERERQEERRSAKHDNIYRHKTQRQPRHCTDPKCTSVRDRRGARVESNSILAGGWSTISSSLRLNVEALLHPTERFGRPTQSTAAILSANVSGDDVPP